MSTERCPCGCEYPDRWGQRTKPTSEFNLTLHRRELASILAGLRLLRARLDNYLPPVSLSRAIDDDTTDCGTIDPLSDAEIEELMRRLG